jgi:hypothetical protein
MRGQTTSRSLVILTRLCHWEMAESVQKSSIHREIRLLGLLPCSQCDAKTGHWRGYGDGKSATCGNCSSSFWSVACAKPSSLVIGGYLFGSCRRRYNPFVAVAVVRLTGSDRPIPARQRISDGFGRPQCALGKTCIAKLPNRRGFDCGAPRFPFLWCCPDKRQEAVQHDIVRLSDREMAKDFSAGEGADDAKWK